MNSAGGDLIGGGEEIDLKKLNLYGFFNTDGVSDSPLSDDESKKESEKESDGKVDGEYEDESDGEVVSEYEDESDGEVDGEYEDESDGDPIEFEEYYRRVKESDGFDVPPYPGSSNFGDIAPVWNLFSDEDVYFEVFDCAVYALEQHNAEVEKYYTFQGIVKANMYPAAGTMYFITFQAEDLDIASHTQNVDQGLENVGPAGGPIVEFEAEVFHGLPDEQRICKMEVMIFRQKGSKGTGVFKGCCGCGSGSGTSAAA